MSKILAERHHKNLTSPTINSSEHVNFDRKPNLFNTTDTNLLTAKEEFLVIQNTKPGSKKTPKTVNLFKKSVVAEKQASSTPILLPTPSSASSSSNFSSTSSSPASSSSFTSFIHSNQVEKITLNETSFMYNNLKRLNAARGGGTANCLHKSSMRARQVIYLTLTFDIILRDCNLLPFY